MNEKHPLNISQCQNDLMEQGFCLVDLKLNSLILELVQDNNFNTLDKEIFKMTANNGLIFKTLQSFEAFKSIEHIISLRSAENDWEEDGIWHDDGSRVLAFSLSLTKDLPEGGVLEIRKKGKTNSLKIPTPNYGTMIIFKTGVSGYEHKINEVIKGKRLIIAGWCS